ncbi:MAG TPA: hypothetical protein VGC34_11735, partial [Steroidobacteraceae bacterium]
AQPYSAVVLGSTGNVGRQIVNLLASSSAVGQVVVVNRRQTDEFIGMSKVRDVVVSDMDKLAAAVEPAAREAGATVAFCAIGVGKGSQKMPEAEVRKIEVQYPESFAKGCKAAGVLSMGLMTAAGADINSSFTYVRIIGEKEKAVSGVGIPALGIYKPSVIFGNSNTPSYLHYIFPAVQWALPSRYHAIHKNELARAMFEGTQKALVELQQKQAQGNALPEPEVEFYEYSDMKPFFNKDDPRD